MMWCWGSIGSTPQSLAFAHPNIDIFLLTRSVFHSFTRRGSELMLEKPQENKKKTQTTNNMVRSILPAKCENNTVIVIKCRIKQKVIQKEETSTTIKWSMNSIASLCKYELKTLHMEVRKKTRHWNQKTRTIRESRKQSMNFFNL